MKNKIVREVMDFVKRHRFIFDQVLREDVSEADELTTEQLNLVVGILSKVWLLGVYTWYYAYVEKAQN